jgi:MFS family permease
MTRNPSVRFYFWLAWALWALTVALMAFTTVVFAALYPLGGSAAVNALDFAVAFLFVATFGMVGALIASRRPKNPIGWIFCGMGLALVVAGFFGNYAQYSLVVEPGALPWAETAAWVGNWIWLVALSPLGLFLLLFPDGRPPSPRWRAVAWVLVAALVCWAVSQAFAPGPMVNAGYESIDNPYGIEALGGLLEVVGIVSGFLVLVAVLASAFSIVVRFLRSRGDERRQIKWVAYAGALVALVIVVQLALETALPETDLLVEVLNLSFVVVLATVPIAAGVAILKYRLYEIDAIINRTLVYGLLTLSLVLVYVVSVVLLRGLVFGFTGRSSQLVVVASTLAVAALFGPLRRRIQGAIDRRFYRSKYDAAKTLAALGEKLREETDLERLGDELVSAAKETVRPAQASLWLRPSGKGSRR